MPKSVRNEEDVIDPMKKIPLRKVPHPPGEFVTGKTLSGTLGPVSHRDHGGFFEVVWRMKVDDTVPSNSGYHVLLRCLFCNERVPCDGEFAMVRVKEEDKIRWYAWAAKVSANMERAIWEVEAKWPPVTA